MTLTDLGNKSYDDAINEASPSFKIGRADHSVAVGGIIGMLLAPSFSSKEGVVDWEWLGVDSREWSPQRLGWETHRVEHLHWQGVWNPLWKSGWLTYGLPVMQLSATWQHWAGQCLKIALCVEQAVAKRRALKTCGIS